MSSTVSRLINSSTSIAAIHITSISITSISITSIQIITYKTDNIMRYLRHRCNLSVTYHLHTTPSEDKARCASRLGSTTVGCKSLDSSLVRHKCPHHCIHVPGTLRPHCSLLKTELSGAKPLLNLHLI